MPFLSPLDTRAYRPGEFVLLGHFGFECELPDRGRFQLWTPRGFVTDFASIPWAVQILPGFDVNGPSRYAAIPHDWLYCNQGRVEIVPRDWYSGQLQPPLRVRLTRAECDEVFRQALLAIGGDCFTRAAIEEPYGAAQARLFWSSVRAGGWWYWRKRRAGVDRSYDFAPEGYLGRVPCAGGGA